MENHLDIARREKTAFYKDMVEQVIPQAQKTYNETIDRIADK